jgi:hypothetical protein
VIRFGLGLFLVCGLSFSAGAEIIFLDLNDAPEEIRHCQAGLDKKHLKQRGEGRREQLHVIDPKEYVSKRGESSLKTKTYHALRSKIQDMIRRNIPIDSIIISGDDGSGEFFGSQGKFHQHELVALVKEFPQVGKSLKSAALWGCYPSTVNGAEQFWVNKLPNMQFTMGFVGQGPDKTRPANHALLKQFCERREEAAEATTMDALCRFYDSIEQMPHALTSLGLCNRVGIASREYSTRGRPEKCFTYRELHARCPSFINNPQYNDIYARYMSGESEPGDEAGRKMSDLRNYYNELQKWRHCSQQFRHQRGSDMPVPANVIRLVKYKKLKENLAKWNAPQLADYDEMLNESGLGALRLGDITQLSRKSMNDKIMAAVAALKGQSVETPVSSPPPRETAPRTNAPCVGGSQFMFSSCEPASTARRPAPSTQISRQPIRPVRNPALLRMAECMRQTFVNMNSECSPFDAVGNYPKSRSICLLSSEEAQDERGEDEAC